MKNTNSGAMLRLVTAGMLASTASLAAAQDRPPADGGAAEEVDSVIIVTAQKRAQAASDVGIALSVVDAQTIRDRRLEAATDLVAFTPNVSVKEQVPGLIPIVTIRGIGLNDFSATNNPATGVYIDEVSLSSLALLGAELYDLERMEVLKGPQGTLYGRNSTAGALNIISARPNLSRMSARVSATLGNFETKQVEAMANLPLSDTLALRLSGKSTFQDEGFFFDRSLARDVGRREVWLGRAQLLWEPADTIEVLIKAEVQHGRSELGSPEFFGLLPTATQTACPGRPTCTNFFGYRDTDGNPFKGDWSVDPAYNFDQTMLTARIGVDLGFAELTAITGYIDFDRLYSADVDASPLRLTDFANTDAVQQFSQEIRLSGESDLVVWQAGVFYARDEVRTTYDGSLQDLFNTTTFTFANQEAETFAVFGNAEWKLTSTISLITGLRYTDETRANIGYTRDLVSRPGGSLLTGAPFGTAPITLASVDDEIGISRLSWKLGVNWKPAADTLIYASVSQSEKSGGFFTGVATSSAQLITYDPETLRAYEIGAKGRFGDKGLGYDLAAFYYDYSDVQTFIQDTIGAIPVQRLGNVETAEVYGADIALTYNPPALPGLSLSGGFGLLSTELGQFVSGSGVVPRGNRLPDAPRFSMNLAAGYEGEVSERIGFRIGTSARYQSDAFTSALNDPLLFSDSYWVVDANAALFDKGNWQVSAWVRNLADARYVTQGLNQLVFGNGFRVYGAPRTFGLTLTKEFN